ncbi:MAG TPA: hypothetical protein VLI05_00985 [Candidatus Saccharimonadia bacterium]|nr:hypothetical protein [Candidatus Saccharimonadia bacterium]
MSQNDQAAGGAAQLVAREGIVVELFGLRNASTPTFTILTTQPLISGDIWEKCTIRRPG